MLGQLGRLCHAPGSKTRRGFSLVEILVVIAALAILAAILFPMFGRMRAAGYQTKCASNMQQLASAFQTYSQDWEDYWPCPGGLAGDYAYWHQTGNGGLEGYVKQRSHKSVWCCPLMPEWKSIYDPRSYCMNSYLREPADKEYRTCVSVLKGIRTSNIPSSNTTILVFEGLPLRVKWEGDPDYVYIYRCCNWTGVKGYSPLSYPKYTFNPGRPWHGRLNNYLYCDGHLRARAPGRCTISSLSSHDEMREWYVDKVRYDAVTWPYWRDKFHAPYE